MEHPKSPFQMASASFHDFKHKRRVLSTVSVVSLCYFSVCGGPVGSEQIVSSGGPLVGIIGLFVFPWLWSIPISLVTAELSTAYPDDGGYTLWVYKAFGCFWGFQEGYWSWIAGVIDNAIYPTLLVSIIVEGYGDFGTPLVKYCTKAAISIVFTIPSLYGVNIVGWTMSSLCIIVLIPFLYMSFYGIASADWSVLLQVRREHMDSSVQGEVDIQWGNLVNILYWNLNGFDGMSVFAGEVANPTKTYPRALAISLIVILASYLFPLCVASANNNPVWWEWSEGSLSEIASNIGGGILVAWIVVSSCISNIGMFMTELFVDSFNLVGMAEQGLAPSFFARRHEIYDTPRNAIYASLIIILGLISFNFDEILVINNFLSALSNVLLLLAAFKLRYSEPKTERPFRVPGNAAVLALMSIAPVLITVYIGYTSIESIKVSIVLLVSVAFGVVLYLLRIKFSGLKSSNFITSHPNVMHLSRSSSEKALLVT